MERRSFLGALGALVAAVATRTPHEPDYVALPAVPNEPLTIYVIADGKRSPRDIYRDVRREMLRRSQEFHMLPRDFIDRAYPDV